MASKLSLRNRRNVCNFMPLFQLFVSLKSIYSSPLYLDYPETVTCAVYFSHSGNWIAALIIDTPWTTRKALVEHSLYYCVVVSVLYRAPRGEREEGEIVTCNFSYHAIDDGWMSLDTLVRSTFLSQNVHTTRPTSGLLLFRFSYEN